jgi:hypothetical protein
VCRQSDGLSDALVLCFNYFISSNILYWSSENAQARIEALQNRVETRVAIFTQHTLGYFRWYSICFCSVSTQLMASSLLVDSQPCCLSHEFKSKMSIAFDCHQTRISSTTAKSLYWSTSIRQRVDSNVEIFLNRCPSNRRTRDVPFS